jgi:hypothetical protein
MSVVYPIYTSLKARDRERSAPVEGETVLVQHDEFLLAGFPAPVTQLCSYINGEWVAIATYAAPEVMTRVMQPDYARPLPPPPPDVLPQPEPKMTLEEHLALHQPNTA